MKRERRKRPGLPPVQIQITVAVRQLGPGANTAYFCQSPAELLDLLLADLASKIGCEVIDLQLDHDPMLRVREYRPRKGKPVASWYAPHAHDPDRLVWRSRRPQDAGSHLVKTYVRGERGQLSDTALAKRERRREKNPDKWTALRSMKKPKPRIKSRFGFPTNRSARKIQSRGFPPKGSRKFATRNPA